MDISSTGFLLYFLPFFLIVYFIVPKKWKILVGVLGSVAFYTWIAGWVILLLLSLIVIDYWLINGMKGEDDKKRKLYLIASIILNITPLLYYKYLGGTTEIKEWTLFLIPVGIGFYTLQKIGYAIDVYRKQSLHFDRILDYAFYILFFPKVVAGPFVELESFGVQIKEIGRGQNADDFISGCVRFSIGLAKKILIANTLAPLVADVFYRSESLSTAMVWFGVLAFAIQLYFDFSGYIDMAIGIALMMGFRLPENFNAPYTSFNVSNFWRNWHHTLYLWLKNYIYLPLGGNKNRTIVNVLLVGIIASLWHQFSLLFMLFGLYHITFIVLEKLGLNNILKKVGKLPSIFYTFLVVLIGWVIVRSDSLEQCRDVFKKLFGLGIVSEEYVINSKQLFIVLLSLVFIFSPLLMNPIMIKEKMEKIIGQNMMFVLKSTIALILLFVSMSYSIEQGFVSFIYMQL